MSMLPDEVLFAILNEPSLDLNELLKLRSVSKRFNRLVVGLKITKLAILNRTRYDYVADRTNEKYSSQLFKFINEPIGSSVVLRTHSNRLLKISTMKQMLSRLKQLSIDRLDFNDRSIGKCFFTPLKGLKELESLQIHWLRLASGGVKRISLPSIRLLSIVQFESFRSKLRLNAPKLSKLALLGGVLYPHVSKLDQLQLVHPETLEEIEIDHYHHELVNYSNLKTIRFKDEKIQDSFSVQRIFTDFPKLEAVYFGQMDWDDQRANRRPRFAYPMYPLYPHEENGLNGLKQAMGELIRSGRKHRNLKVKIYLMDFRVESESYLDDLFGRSNTLDVKNTRLVLKNYRKLASVTTAIDTIQYAELAHHFDNAIPSDFQQRFVNIRVVSLERKEGDQKKLDQQRFLEFIEKCHVLNVLQLKHVALDASSYSRLSLCCAYLTTLRIELEEPVETPDMSFILDHEHLNELSINRLLKYELIEKAFTDLKFFKVLKYEMNGKPIEIDRNRGYAATGHYSGVLFNISNKCLNSNQDVEFLEALRNLFALAGLD